MTGSMKIEFPLPLTSILSPMGRGGSTTATFSSIGSGAASVYFRVKPPCPFGTPRIMKTALFPLPCGERVRVRGYHKSIFASN